VIWLLVIALVIAELLVTEIIHRIDTKKGAARMARTIANNSKALYSGPSEFAEIRAADFGDLNHQLYNRAQAELEAFDFRYLADIENLTATRQMPTMRTFIRALSGDHGSTSAGIYHLKLRGFHRFLQRVGVLPREALFIDLESEFSDGSFLATSNTRGRDLSSDVPGILRQSLPVETTVPDLVAAHRKQFAIQCREGRTATRAGSLAEIRAMQNRLQEAKNRHKKSLGFVDGEQLARIAAKHGNAELNHQLALELKTLRAQNLAASSSTTGTPAVSGR
jgi:hypothetical protein